VETTGGIVKEMAAKAVDMFLSRDVSALEEVERLDDEVVDESYEGLCWTC
jgi:phosphate transport system protein